MPGTNHDKEAWTDTGSASGLLDSISQTFGETAQVASWSGDNTQSARLEAAQSIVGMINGAGESEQINIVGHSHGGNIGILVSQMTDRKINNLVTLGTPVRDDYSPNYDMIGNHINAYSMLDPVQVVGGSGGFTNPLPGIGLISNYLQRNLEAGPAGRQFSGAVNVNATGGTRSLYPIGVHTNQWKSPSVWSKVNSVMSVQ